MSTKERPRATRTQALQSPFVDEEVLTWGPAQAWEPRTSALVTHSAFVHPRAQPDTTHPALEADTRLIATEANGAPWADEDETEDVSERQDEPKREDALDRAEASTGGRLMALAP